MGGAYGAHGRQEKNMRHSVGRPDGKRQFTRPRSRLEGNIKMYLQELGWGHGLN